MMNERKIMYIARGNADIFREEWCVGQEGAFHLLHFPLFDFWVEYWATDDNLFRISLLAIRYLDTIDDICKARGYDKDNFESLMDCVKGPNAAEEFTFGCMAVYQRGGPLYSPIILHIVEELRTLLCPLMDDWLMRGRFYVYKSLFLAAMVTVGHMDDPDDVNSSMEYLLKALCHAGGREIEPPPDERANLPSLMES